MSDKVTRRGFDPDDAIWFSSDAILLLSKAQEEIQWLLDRGHKLGPALEFISNHYQISSRQRSALQRASSSQSQYERRASSMLALTAAKDGCLYIDGFNLIITLETALSGGVIVRGKDNVYRDLAGVRGSYRLNRQTETALDLIGLSFKELNIPEAVIYLDQPVSNSGRLRGKILEYSNIWDIPVRVELVPNADVLLSHMERVVTGDSIILDRCVSWFNLSAMIIDNYIKNAWIVNFSEL